MPTSVALASPLLPSPPSSSSLMENTLSTASPLSLHVNAISFLGGRMLHARPKVFFAVVLDHPGSKAYDAGGICGADHVQNVAKIVARSQ